MGRFTEWQIPEFAGLNEDENPHLVADAELVKAQNCWRRGRTTGTRPGTRLDSDVYVDGVITSGNNILGIVDFRRLRDTERYMVVVEPGIVHKDASTTLTAGAGVDVANTSGLPIFFAQHKQKLYASGGDIAGGDTCWYWDPDDAVDVDTMKLLEFDTLTSTAQARYIIEWDNRIWGAGFDDEDESANGGIVRYSELNVGEVQPAENSIGGNSVVGGFLADADEYVTGLSTYRDNEGRWLFVLTNRRIYTVAPTGNSLAPYRISDEITNGCVSQSVYVPLGVDSGDAVYMSEHGIHGVNQSQDYGARQDRFLSWKIRKTFRTINMGAIHKSWGAYWREVGLVVFAVPTGSSGEPDTLLVLDVKDVDRLNADTSKWYVWRLSADNQAITYMHTGRDVAGNWRIYCGDTIGRVWTFDESESDDLDTGFEVSFQTKHQNFGAVMSEKGIGDLVIDMQPGGTWQPSLSLIGDFGQRVFGPYNLDMFAAEDSTWGPTGNFVWGTSRWSSEHTTRSAKVYPEGGGKTLSLLFQYSGNRPFYVTGVFGQVSKAGESSQSARSE